MTSTMFIVETFAASESVRTKFSTPCMLARSVAFAISAVIVSEPDPPRTVSKVFQELVVVASKVVSPSFTEALALLAAVVRLNSRTSAVVEVSFTTTELDDPSAVRVIVFASVSESATNETTTVAKPSTPSEAEPDRVPPTTSAASTPVIE